MKNNVSQTIIIVVSIQVMSKFSDVVQPLFYVESWAHLPKERDRLFKLITDSNRRGVIFISGEVHCGEITRYDGGEITMQGVQRRWNVNAWSRYMF